MSLRGIRLITLVLYASSSSVHVIVPEFESVIGADLFADSDE